MASFPKESRLLNSTDFEYLRRGAKVLSTPLLRFYYKESRLPNTCSRIGLSVSKKAGNSVQRNVIKRFLRESFRNSDWVSTGEDILIVASPRLKALFKEKRDVKTELKKSWSKAIERRNSK